MSDELKKLAEDHSGRSDYHPDVSLRCSVNDHWNSAEKSFLAGWAARGKADLDIAKEYIGLENLQEDIKSLDKDKNG